MKSVVNSDPFIKPVDPVQFPAYKDYISCPMDLQVDWKLLPPRDCNDAPEYGAEHSSQAVRQH